VENVGKRCGHARVAQHQIHSLMINAAREGWTVVRLKSGDPLVFGRAGEEMEALRRAGVAYEDRAWNYGCIWCGGASRDSADRPPAGLEARISEQPPMRGEGVIRLEGSSFRGYDGADLYAWSGLRRLGRATLRGRA